MPVRHGMTLGELAQLFNGEMKIGASLTVIPAANWRRDHWYDETGLSWINPSPNMRNLNQATLYPGIGAIEYSNVSVGRGTDQPFEQIGAPWINGRALAETLNASRAGRHPVLSRYLHAHREQVRQRRMRGGVHGDHQSHGAPACARGTGNRGRIMEAARRSVQDGNHRSAARIACRAWNGPRLAKTPPALLPAGPPAKRAGGNCARNTCSIAEKGVGPI